jgi:hypothetical protein
MATTTTTNQGTHTMTNADYNKAIIAMRESLQCLKHMNNAEAKATLQKIAELATFLASTK